MIFDIRRKQPASVEDELPDLDDKDVQEAATKIQAAFKGHKIRKTKKSRPKPSKVDDLPDLKCKDVQEAAVLQKGSILKASTIPFLNFTLEFQNHIHSSPKTV